MFSIEVDFDGFENWPLPVRQGFDRHLSGAGYDPEGFQYELGFALVGTSLRCYHCTRLLDSEADAVKSQGLRPARDMLTEKMQAAFDDGPLQELCRPQDPLVTVSFFVWKRDLKNVELVDPFLVVWGASIPPPHAALWPR